MHNYLVAFILLILPIEAIAQKETIINSTLKAGAVKDYIKKEREFLHGLHKVDLPKKFLKESKIIQKRYGTKKTVLNLNGLSFSGTDLSGVVFTLASMQKTNLQDANLQNSEFTGVDFLGADLRDADFSRSDLSNVRFEAVSLKGAKFDGANLFNAKFIKVKDLSKPELAALKKKTNSYVVLEREKLKGHYENE